MTYLAFIVQTHLFPEGFKKPVGVHYTPEETKLILENYTISATGPTRNRAIKTLKQSAAFRADEFNKLMPIQSVKDKG